MPQIDISFLDTPKDITPRPEGSRFSDHDPLEDGQTGTTNSGANLEGPRDLTVPTMTVEAKAPSSKLPFGPLRILNPNRMASKAALFEQLIPTIALNEFDLPNYYYRADLLDHDHIREQLLSLQANNSSSAVNDNLERQAKIRELQSMLDAASVQLIYDEGFPTIPSGTPYWSRLDAEPSLAFEAFFSYLEMGGARQLHLLSAHPIGDLKAWFHIYGWTHRVKAFDLFKIANAQKIRLQRMLSTEDDHYFMAERILKQVDAHIKANAEDLLGALSLPEAVSILEKLVKVQRISAGLLANGGAVETPKPPSYQPVHAITQNAVEESRTQRSEIVDEYDLLSDDPDAIDIAQELIIRTQRSAKENAKGGADHRLQGEFLPVIDQPSHASDSPADLLPDSKPIPPPVIPD